MNSEQLLQRIARPELLAMSGYVSARMEAGSAEVILNANENPYAPELDGTADWQINRYPPPQPQQVIQQLAKLYGVAADQVLVTRGSDEGIDLLTRAFCQRGHRQGGVLPAGVRHVCGRSRHTGRAG